MGGCRVAGLSVSFLFPTAVSTAFKFPLLFGIWSPLTASFALQTVCCLKKTAVYWSGISGLTKYMERFSMSRQVLHLILFDNPDHSVSENILFTQGTSGKNYRSGREYLEVLCWEFIPHRLSLISVSSPGFLDIQINGAYGFDFSVYENDDDSYRCGLGMVAQRIIETGVTSYGVLTLHVECSTHTALDSYQL